jgi:hypothetical protein
MDTDKVNKLCTRYEEVEWKIFDLNRERYFLKKDIFDEISKTHTKMYVVYKTSLGQERIDSCFINEQQAQDRLNVLAKIRRNNPRIIVEKLPTGRDLQDLAKQKKIISSYVKFKNV